jgi:hypothetical protein
MRGDTWTISAAGHKRIRVRYERPLQRARFDYDQSASEADVLHYGAEPVYLYVVDRKTEPCILELVVSAAWKKLFGRDMTSQEMGCFLFRCELTPDSAPDKKSAPMSATHF